jgi:hypothetical protein
MLTPSTVARYMNPKDIHSKGHIMASELTAIFCKASNLDNLWLNLAEGIPMQLSLFLRRGRS